MINDEIIEIVKKRIHSVMKQPLIDYTIEKGLTTKSSITKDAAAEIIYNSIDAAMAYDMLERFKGIIGFSYYDVEQRLSISGNERKKWTKKGLLKVTGTYKTRAYGKYLDSPIYDPLHILSITQELISEWRSNSILTEKQMQGIKKAQAAAIKNRTCVICGHIKQHKNHLINGWCKQCLNRKKAYERRKYWLDNKNNYVILDTETTGLGSKDQIIEIAIIDLDDNVLLDKLVMPTVDISIGAYQVHGMSINYLIDNNAVSWDKVYPEVNEILENKTIIAYNAEFDDAMIYNTCRAYGLKSINNKFECLMNNVMLEYSSDRYMKIQDVACSFQSHRALDDCRLCLEVINRNMIGEHQDDKDKT